MRKIHTNNTHNLISIELESAFSRKNIFHFCYNRAVRAGGGFCSLSSMKKKDKIKMKGKNINIGSLFVIQI